MTCFPGRALVMTIPNFSQRYTDVTSTYIAIWSLRFSCCSPQEMTLGTLRLCYKKFMLCDYIVNVDFGNLIASLLEYYNFACKYL